MKTCRSERWSGGQDTEHGPCGGAGPTQGWLSFDVWRPLQLGRRFWFLEKMEPSVPPSNAPGRHSHPPGAGMLPKLESVSTLGTWELGICGSSLTWKTLSCCPWQGTYLSTAWSLKYGNTELMHGDKSDIIKKGFRMIQKLEPNQSHQLREKHRFTPGLSFAFFLVSPKRHSNIVIWA